MPEAIVTKRCSKCKDFKAFSEFTKNRTKKNGIQSQCKTCEKQYKQTEKYKTKQKRYHQSEKGKVAIRRYHQSEKYKAARKRFRQSEKGKAADKRYFQNQLPKQIKARHAINHAIESGKLPRPDSLQCHYCPAKAKQYHHHKGYEPEHYLDVVPVCTKCHYRLRIKKGAAPKGHS